MIQNFLKRFGQMLLVIAVQVLVLNHIHLWGLATPMLQVMFLFKTPLNEKPIVTMLWAFCLGLVVDTFTNTPGMCAGAMTLTAFLQPRLLQVMAPKDSVEDIVPSRQTLGRWTFLTYRLILMMVYVVAFFLLESFSFFNITHLVLAMASSMALSMVLAISVEGVFKK